MSSSMPGLSSVQDGMAELMRRANNCFNPANLNVEVIQINSAQQAEFEVGASYSGFGASVSASLSSANSKSQSLFLAKLNQVYFSISVPDKPIGSDAIPADLVYVSKVNYGRVGYLLIESSASSETIRASLEGGYAGATVSVSARLTNSDSRTKITSFFLGGDALNIPSITTASGLDQWMNYMRAGLRINPSVAPFPVSYELKYLNDNMTARVSSTSRYTQSECVTAPGLDIIFHNVTVSRQDINEGLSSDGGRLWGDVKFRVVGPTSPTNRAERVYLNEIPYSITEDRRGSRDGIWGRKSAFPCEYDREPDNKLNGATYSVKVHPDILDRVFLEVTMQIGTKHKDNDFAPLGWHGMSQPETYRRSLRFLLDQNANRNISCPNGPSEERQWGSETPRYCSNTDRVHCFTTLFTVKPTTVN